jgi:predicted TIM-barrel fold metal-dependent hydrolase
MLQPNMPIIDDLEGTAVPAGLPAVIDAHVHIFPGYIFPAVWQWFDRNGWQIRYRMSSSQVLSFLLSKGVSHVIAFQYAHKPGIAEGLNRYMARKCAEFAGRVTGMATVYPGEPKAEKILANAFNAGLGGVKLHAHVQCFLMNSAAMHRLYDCCRDFDKPLVMHVGREPKSTAYRCDPYQICRAAELELVLQRFPGLRICVPHLGLGEILAYRQLLERHENLWLDTAMAVADYLPPDEPIDLQLYRHDRIMYGSDFPNIPYAWDRELNRLQAHNLGHDALAKLLYENAAKFYGVPPETSSANSR